MSGGELSGDIHAPLLAAVVVIDTVGSTSRRAELGETAANALDLAERSAMNDTVRRHGGDVIDFTGDGAIALLPSASAALAAGLELCGPQFRIGVAVGEVRSVDGTWGGGALTTAAWLERRCPPGAVAAAALVMQTASARPSAAVEPLADTPPGSSQPDAVVLRPSP